jgi:hypothetical protein
LNFQLKVKKNWWFKKNDKKTEKCIQNSFVPKWISVGYTTLSFNYYVHIIAKLSNRVYNYDIKMFYLFPCALFRFYCFILAAYKFFLCCCFYSIFLKFVVFYVVTPLLCVRLSMAKFSCYTHSASSGKVERLVYELKKPKNSGTGEKLD